jgi:hypothetical protein
MQRGTRQALERFRPMVAFAIAFSIFSACRRGSSPSSSLQSRAGQFDAGLTTLALHVDASSFDLAVGAGGSVLGWLSDGPGRASLWLARFDAGGALAGRPERHALERPGRDLSIVATALGTFAIWREGQGATAVARGILARSAQDVRFELGSTWENARAARGNLALAARGDTALALVRGPEESCGDGNVGPCFGFRFYQLSAAGAHEMEFPLRVPAPCDSRSVMLVPVISTPPAGAPGPHLNYAVCTDARPGPQLTVFSIEPERSYAEAQRLFEGCTPLGAGVFAGQVSFVAECGGVRRLARLRSGDAAPELHQLDAPGLLCTAHGARLRLGEEWLALDLPSDRLELVLDAETSPAGSRAAWSGSALLVARVREGELQLSRFACSGSALQDLGNPLGALPAP